MSYILNCTVASLATTVYCLLLQRSLSVSSLEPLLLLNDGNHLLLGLLRPTVYCTVKLMDVPHMTVLTEQLNYCLNELF